MASLTPRIDAIESGRNLIINGNFDFFQRGVSDTTSNNSFLADRFRRITNHGNIEMHRSTDVPNKESLYSLRFAFTASQGGSLSSIMRYRLEGNDIRELRNRSFVLSFWIKSGVTGTYSVTLFNPAGGNDTYVATYSISAANTWERKAIVVPARDFATTWELSTGAGLDINWRWAGTENSTGTINAWHTQAVTTVAASTQANGAINGNSILISQISLVVGSSVDLPFSRAGRTIQEEMAMCQRYYEKSYQLDTFAGAVGHDFNLIYLRTSSNTVPNSETYGRVFYLVAKRATPSVTVYGYGGTSGRVSNGSGADIANSATVNSSGQNGFNVFNGSGGSITTTFLEVNFHYTADAEL